MSNGKTKSDIVSKIFAMAAVSFFVITAVFLVCFFQVKKSEKNYATIDETAEMIVALNEIDNLLEDSSETKVAKEKISELMDSLNRRNNILKEYGIIYFGIFYVLSILSIVIIYFVVYQIILKPFTKLEEFAGEIAAGNLDVDLKYERVHMFGEFTWAFDHMRREIKRARQCEKEAIENNKTMIATLSHDIKTPIASIRAYSEALSVNMDSSAKRRERYLEVILRKCDEVTKITNDMFLHSLHDLDKLVMKKEEVEIHNVILETVEAMQGDKENILLGKIDECTLQGCDKDRIVQVLENLISNARKYAPGEIRICGFRNPEDAFLGGKVNETLQKDCQYIITVKDTGNGITDEDMPFIFEKFYRGKNIGEQAGAGLGLFIVKYIMEQMGGSVSIENHSDGMEVTLFF